MAAGTCLDKHGVHHRRAVHVLLEVLVQELKHKVQVVVRVDDFDQPEAPSVSGCPSADKTLL